MFGPDDPDAVAVRPATPGAGTPGWFQDGDPTAVPPKWPTLVRDWFLNMLVAELSNLLAFVEVVPDKANDSQVLEAVQRIARAPGPRAIWNTPGVHTWTCPAGVYSVTPHWISMGGRGGDGTPSAPGHGGGGGAYITDAVATVPGTDYDVTISPAGDVSGFGLFAPAGGAAAPNTPGPGGVPSGGSANAIRLQGGGGGYGYVAGTLAFGGTGGASARYYGPNTSINNGGTGAASNGQAGATGQGGTGAPNGSGGAGGAPLAELHW